MTDVDVQAESIAPQRTTFLKNDRARLYGTVLADHFDTELDHFYATGNPGRPLLIDFSEAAYIEIAALCNCIATLAQRNESNYQTFIGCPSQRPVRDFLKVWRFPEAIRQATGNNIQDYALQEDADSWDEPAKTYTGCGDAVNKLEYDPDWSVHKGTARNFFEFITFSDESGTRIGPGGRFASAPRDEGKKWTRPLIHQVLEKHLPGKTTKDEVARVIIFEAMSNAVRHPAAQIIQVVSKVERPGERSEREKLSEHPGKSSGYLRICIWDDGLSIAQTLFDALKDGRSIHAPNLPSYMLDKVHVVVRPFDKSKNTQVVIDQSDWMAENLTEGRLLLASLFPGVTRTLSKEVAKVTPFEEPVTDPLTAAPLADALNSAPGMGLYALTRTAVDQFNGSLVVRSGCYRMKIASANDAFRTKHGVRYKCKITQYPAYVPAFKGNLLTIQLPLKGS